MLTLGALYSQADDVERLKGEIMKKLVELLAPEHQNEKIYIDKSCGKVDFPVQMVGRIVNNPAEADVILACDLNRLHLHPVPSSLSGKTVITLSYKEYIRHKNLAAGAFFWQKGRPNIIINARYIQRRHIRIPRSYRPFVE